METEVGWGQTILRGTVGFAVLFIVLGASPATAQSLLIDERPIKSVSIEVLKPNLSTEGLRSPEPSVWTSTIFLTGRYPLGEKTFIAADLPLSHFGVESNVGSSGETVVGNPYLGVEIGGREDARFVGEVGLRLPVDGEDDSGRWDMAREIGLFTEFTERFDAFLADVTTLSGALNYVFENEMGFGIQMRGRPSLLLIQDDQNEFWITYSAHGWYAMERVRLGGGFSGLFAARTEADLDVSERVMHQIGLSTVGVFERVQPGLHLRIPIDEVLRETVNYSVGVSLTVSFE